MNDILNALQPFIPVVAAPPLLIALVWGIDKVTPPKWDKLAGWFAFPLGIAFAGFTHTAVPGTAPFWIRVVLAGIGMGATAVGFHSTAGNTAEHFGGNGNTPPANPPPK